MMATVANEGYYTPHIIKRIEGHKIDKNSQLNTLPLLIKNIQTHD
jgi:cell division protein FtsI/penicillin-binding protein 2